MLNFLNQEKLFLQLLHPCINWGPAAASHEQLLVRLTARRVWGQAGGCALSKPWAWVTETRRFINQQFINCYKAPVPCIKPLHPCVCRPPQTLQQRTAWFESVQDRSQGLVWNPSWLHRGEDRHRDFLHFAVPTAAAHCTTWITQDHPSAPLTATAWATKPWQTPYQSCWAPPFPPALTGTQWVCGADKPQGQQVKPDDTIMSCGRYLHSYHFSYKTKQLFNAALCRRSLESGFSFSGFYYFNFWGFFYTAFLHFLK